MPQGTADAILTALTHVGHLQFLPYTTPACLRHVLRHPTAGSRVKTVSMDLVASELKSLVGLLLPKVMSIDFGGPGDLHMLPNMPRLQTLTIRTQLHPMRCGMARVLVRRLETVTDLTLIDPKDAGVPDRFMRSIGVAFPLGAGQQIRRAKVTPSAVMWFIPDCCDDSADAASSDYAADMASDDDAADAFSDDDDYAADATSDDDVSADAISDNDDATDASSDDDTMTAPASDLPRYKPPPPLALTHLELLGSDFVPIASLQCDFSCLINLVSLMVKLGFCKQEENKQHDAHLSVYRLQQLATLPYLAFLDAPVAAPNSKPGATWVQQVAAVAVALRGQRVFPALERVVTTRIFFRAIQPARLPRLTDMTVSIPEKSWFVSKLYMPMAPLLTDLIVIAPHACEITKDTFSGRAMVQEAQPVDGNPVLCERAPLLKSYVWQMPKSMRETMYKYPFKIL
ncbi:hypothetical protein GGF32_001473 [Allomyces javanicus]|nr:hypothetical protein GGF32_001473 [Allomyces javanicus]